MAMSNHVHPGLSVWIWILSKAKKGYFIGSKTGKFVL